jgi:hypothetical protein
MFDCARPLPLLPIIQSALLFSCLILLQTRTYISVSLSYCPLIFCPAVLSFRRFEILSSVFFSSCHVVLSSVSCCCPVTLSLCFPPSRPTLSPCCIVIVCPPMTMSFRHPVHPSPCPPVTLSTHHPVLLSPCFMIPYAHGI